ncbi:MAG: ABC transporter substrate-binding protein, partial [Acidobacteriaceae bacterium]
MPDIVEKSISFLKQAWQGLKLLPNLRKNQIPHLFESFTKKDILQLLIFAVLFLSAGGFLVYGTSRVDSGQPAYGGELTEGILGQPRFINPILAPATNVDSDVSRIFFSRLVKFDQNLNLVPDLAESLPQISADQKSYTFKLRQNLKWDDGKPLRADDIIYTVSLVQNEDYQSPLRTAWSRVRVEKIDDYTLSFKLPDISSPFITSIAQLGILPKHVWENIPAGNFPLSDINLSPVGSGPFSFREI